MPVDWLTVSLITGGSISFAECVVGLSFVLVRDIRLPQYEMTIEGSPEFLDIAFRFLDREKRGVLTKMGICKVPHIVYHI